MQEVWVSGVRGDHSLGDKPGMVTKFYGHGWPPATHVQPLLPPEVYENMSRAGKGETLLREHFPEASYVFSEKHFLKTKDFFWIGGFVAVKGKLAEILPQFNLGEGGLIPYPVFKDDQKTPIDEPCFLLNWGGAKDNLLTDKCNKKKMKPILTVEKNGRDYWRFYGVDDHDVVLSNNAFTGIDFWAEKKVKSQIFMSGELADAIMSHVEKINFQWAKCLVE